MVGAIMTGAVIAGAIMAGAAVSDTRPGTEMKAAQ
jgi:hypothetical protein